MQNVKTPRFFINIIEYLGAIGYTTIDDIYRLNPTILKPTTSLIETSVPTGIFTEKSFVAFLGHSKGELNLSKNYTSDISINAQINDGEDNSLSPEYEGFSIASFDGLGVDDAISTYNENEIGSIVVGNYYDMPHSPDLNLKLSYEYDGINNTQTKGGATLSNAAYTKPADWGEYGAWQLGDNQNYRSGRRIWDLSFSYLSDTDVMPNLGVQNYVDGATGEDILTGTDFFSQIINRTMGGHLPFIFQSDNSSSSPDSLAICRFDMSSFSYDQVAHNVYNIKLKIKETW